MSGSSSVPLREWQDCPSLSRSGSVSEEVRDGSSSMMASIYGAAQSAWRKPSTHLIAYRYLALSPCGLSTAMRS